MLAGAVAAAPEGGPVIGPVPVFLAGALFLWTPPHFWALAAANGKLVSTWRSMSTPRRWKLVLAGSILGPSIGVWVALIGITHAPVGVASTLMALTPLFVIPLVVLTQGEHVSKRAALGAVIAFSGVALLFVT